MPVTVRHKRSNEKGKDWKIVEKSSGRVVGQSDTKKDASISASYRNQAHRRKHGK